MRVIVDAFGGDNAPDEILRGAALAAADGYSLALAGDEPRLRERAAALEVPLDGIALLHAADVITMEDEPRSILKAHRSSSMAVGLQALARGEGDAFVSAGSTGALIMGATFFVKRINGVSRAAIATLLPTAEGKPSMLLDAGANADCRPEMLRQFAQMGSVYMSRVMGDGQPATVGLVNIGTEDCKGGELQQQAFTLIQQSLAGREDVRFIGNVEARQVPFGAADVLVADGFTGNVLLKCMEGSVGMLMQEFKKLFNQNPKTRAAGAMMKPYLSDLKKRMNTSEYGGAPVLGVCRPVIKAHGNSNAQAIRQAVRVAAEFAASGAIDAITAAVQEKGESLDEGKG